MDQIILSVLVTIEFDTKAPKRLRTKEIEDAISGAVSGCSQIEDRGSVTVESREI
jgi:hypothetical protein